MAFNAPIAYFITFTTYGTRLHGDERGSRHKRDGPLEPDVGRVEYHARQLKNAPVLLDAPKRGAVEDGIREVCAKRNWRVITLNVRTNHVHVVLASSMEAYRTMGQLKAFATKMLRVHGLVSTDQRVWTEGGSTKKLFTHKHVDDACSYVASGQGPDLPRV